MRHARRIAFYGMLAIVGIAAAGVAVIYAEGRWAPHRTGEYVALGSSFAAGPRLGPLAPGSSHACWQTAGNYAHQLARAARLHLADVSCGGATSRNLLVGGPFFQPPQVEAVGSSTRLVTITVGGNDVDYIGDLGLLAYRAQGGALGSLVRALWKGPRPADDRPYDKLTARLIQIVDTVQRRSPSAVVVLMTYPQVLPASGICATIGIGAQDADLMRRVAARLAQATRDAAFRSKSLLVDMAALSVGHDACSIAPWVNGNAPSDGAMFHPNRAGARAAADALQRLVLRLREDGWS
jgi:lysophospholipase L1-like esterase